MRLSSLLLLICSVFIISARGDQESELENVFPRYGIPPRGDAVRAILSAVCPGRVVAKDGKLACDPSTPELPERRWNPPLEVDRVMLGHFLTSDSEDAVVSGSRLESHPYRWGGTLFLTKNNGKWMPLWYHSGTITRHCLPFSTTAGNEVLVCASGYTGSGHRTTTLYVLTLSKSGPREEVILGTDTFDWRDQTPVVAQKQELVKVERATSGEMSLVEVRLRHGRRQGRAATIDPFSPGFPTVMRTLRFALHGTRFTPVDSDAQLFNSLFNWKR